MVSFSCEGCGDVLTKGKLDKHRNQCRHAQFTCLDCQTTFQGVSYKTHTSCISEAQKYEGSFYKGPNNNNSNSTSTRKSSRTLKDTTQPQPAAAMIPRKAYVEDASQDTEMRDSGPTPAQPSASSSPPIGVPPRAPSPPPAGDGPNVYDFLVREDGAAAGAGAGGTAAAGRSAPSENDPHYARHGYSYGSGPLAPRLERYDSYASLAPQAGSAVQSQSQDEQLYLTPAPGGKKKDKRRHETGEGGAALTTSDKKRKREREGGDEHHHAPSSSLRRESGPLALTSGLTGGLSRLLGRGEESARGGVEGVSPSGGLKRSKHDKSMAGRESGKEKERRPVGRRRGSSSSEDAGRSAGQKAIEYRRHGGGESNGGSGGGQLVRYRCQAEMFLSFVTKGEESQRGQSMNKLLKRYHRESGTDKDKDRESNDKELWKELRVRKNEKGEFVLFV